MEQHVNTIGWYALVQSDEVIEVDFHMCDGSCWVLAEASLKVTCVGGTGHALALERYCFTGN